MASNLNKAFMRAYAKDRPATTDDTSVAPATTQAPVVAPTSGQPDHSSRINPVAQPQPSMEPTVFAGRYTPPPIVQPPAAQPRAVPSPVAQPQAVRPQPTNAQPQPVRAPIARPQVAQAQAVPSQPAPAKNTMENSARSMNAATSANVHRIPAPSMQANSNTAQPQLRVVTTAARPAPPTASARTENVQPSDRDEASRVWQRIDAAHGSQATHPTEPQSRPTASVSATRTAAPKRMQAAAAPAPVAPPIPNSPARFDTPSQPGARPLPLVGDDVSSNNDAQPAEARRRTVADFLYAAGQYNPGRVLASADNSEVAMAPAATATTTSPILRTSEMLRSMDSVADSAVMNHQSVADVQTAFPPAQPAQTYVAPAIEEPMPRRMGQILRVDVPRGHNAATAMPAAAPVAMPAQPVQQPMPQPAPAQPVMPSAPSAMPTSAPSLDAPVAKYVLEQRRMDRAHKLNEAEDKLRRSTHKIFNPVWEVDSLQWPVVVDKLMQQRAQSMSHVAEHMKAACQDGLSVLGVTSASHGEGRTTVACCLARLAAAHGLNVALVDIDLDHPTLCVQTNMEVEHDWRDCLSEDVTLEEVAVHSIDDQLTVLPLKPRGGRPGLLASDSRIADILADLSESFELVIVDCSKTSSSGNVITGLAHTKIFDAAIVVVDRRDSEADRVEDAVRMIQQTGIESIGIVDNFSM